MNKNGRILLTTEAVALLLLIGAGYVAFVIYESGFGTVLMPSLETNI
jgi:hypothetical protein